MDMTLLNWRGYWVASPTPFRHDGAFDEPALRDLLRLYRSQGVHGVLLNGTTGEWFSQSSDERRRVAEIGVEELGGHVPVVVGCSSFTPRETIGLAEHARDIGADGTCATPPPYVHLTSEEIVVFYETVAAAVDVPWMVYNWPRGTAVDIDIGTLERLAAIERVVAIKDSTGDELKCAEACAALSGKVAFFGRFIHRMGLAVYREYGGAGNIDGGGLGAPFAVAYFQALWAGDLDAARARSDCYMRLSSALVRSDFSGRFGSPTAQLKAAMRLLGQPGGFVRPPLVELENKAALTSLGAVLAAAGIEGARVEPR